MARIAIGGFQHETNTFAPSKADYAAFEAGGGWPGVQYGEPIFAAVEGANIPAAGAIQALRALGHSLVGTAWARGEPVGARHRRRLRTDHGRDRPAGSTADGPSTASTSTCTARWWSSTYDDGEGELLRRVREPVGPRVPVVASLDLHANVTRAMFERADALVAYRTYPHVDMAETGARAARVLDADAARRAAARGGFHQLDYLTGIPSQCSFIEPCKGIYRDLAGLEEKHGVCCRSRPASRWPTSPTAACRSSATAPTRPPCARLRGAARRDRGAKDFAWSCTSADAAVRRAMRRGEPGAPVVLADTQDNPGAGGNGDTTGLLTL